MIGGRLIEGQGVLNHTSEDGHSNTRGERSRQTRLAAEVAHHHVVVVAQRLHPSSIKRAGGTI